MANITRRFRPSVFNLRRDIDDVLDEFVSPRGLRREIDRLFSEDLAPRSMWRELDQLFEDFVSPMPLRRRVGELFEPFGGGLLSGGGAAGRAAMFIPEIELVERDKEYLVKVDLPGLRSEDVDVSVEDGNILTIRGERRDEQTRESRGYEYTERSYGSFARSIELPRGVDASKIEAEHNDGVLQLHVPKSEQATARKVPVRIGQAQREQGREPGQGRGQQREAQHRGEPQQREQGGERGQAEQPRVMSPQGQGAEPRERERPQANSR